MISSILLNILSPILMLMALLRWKFKIDIGTLSKINIYLRNPAFIFDKVSRSTLSWAEMGGRGGGDRRAGVFAGRADLRDRYVDESPS